MMPISGVNAGAIRPLTTAEKVLGAPKVQKSEEEDRRLRPVMDEYVPEEPREPSGGRRPPPNSRGTPPRSPMGPPPGNRSPIRRTGARRARRGKRRRSGRAAPTRWTGRLKS